MSRSTCRLLKDDCVRLTRQRARVLVCVVLYGFNCSTSRRRTSPVSATVTSARSLSLLLFPVAHLRESSSLLPYSLYSIFVLTYFVFLSFFSYERKVIAQCNLDPLSVPSCLSTVCILTSLIRVVSSPCEYACACSNSHELVYTKSCTLSACFSRTLGPTDGTMSTCPTFTLTTSTQSLIDV